MGMKISPACLTDKYICVMLLVFPLWTGFEGYGNITFWKFAFFAAVTGLWLASLAVSALAGRERPRPYRPFALLCALLLAWAALSYLVSPFSPDLMGRRYDGLLPLALYVLAGLGCSAYGEFKWRYVNLLGVSVTLCCLVAALQLAGLNPLWLYPEGFDFYGAGVDYNGAFLGTLGNTNILGGFLALSCPLLAFSAVNRRESLWLLLPAALGAAICALGGCEAALVGLMGSALVFVPYYVYQEKRRLGLAVLAFEAAAGLAALLWLYLAAPESGTLHELGELLHGRVEDSFGSSRVAIWREALRLFGERPVLGGGPGSFALRSTLEFTRYVPETGLTFHTLADSAHSEILSALTELGVVGGACYVTLAAHTLRRSLRTPLAPALLAYLLQALFSTGTCFTLPLLAILSALSAAARHTA